MPHRETKSRKIANEDVTGEADKVGCTQQSMDAWLESSIASFATQRDSVESEAQDLEAKAKGKREKKQIKDREAVRTGYIDFHRENLEIVLRMLRVERLSPGMHPLPSYLILPLLSVLAAPPPPPLLILPLPPPSTHPPLSLLLSQRKFTS